MNLAAIDPNSLTSLTKYRGKLKDVFPLKTVSVAKAVFKLQTFHDMSAISSSNIHFTLHAEILSLSLNLKVGRNSCHVHSELLILYTMNLHPVFRLILLESFCITRLFHKCQTEILVKAQPSN